jgi:protein-tyrosine phosphatase
MEFFKLVKSLLGKTKQLFFDGYSTAVYMLLVKNVSHSPPPKIFFVCHGNICRSAFAHAYVLQKKTTQPIPNELIFNSFGIKAIQDNTPPENAINVAHLLGVDLSRHKAKILRKEEIGKDDWLIGMDFRNFIQLRKMFFERKGNNIFLLRHFGRKCFEPINIRDPYGKSEEKFNDCFLLLAKHVNCLIAQLDIK